MTKNNETLRILKTLLPAIKRIEGGWYSEVKQFILDVNAELEKANSSFRFEADSEIQATGLGGKFQGEFVHGLRVVDLSSQEIMTPALAYAVAFCSSGSDDEKPRKTGLSPHNDPDAVLILGSRPPAYLKGPLDNCRPDQILDADTSMIAAYRSEDLGMPDLNRAILVLFAAELSAQLGRPVESILTVGLRAGDFPYAGVAFEFDDGSAGVFRYAFFLEKKDAVGIDMYAVFTEHCGYRLFRGPGVVVQSICRTPGGDT